MKNRFGAITDKAIRITVYWIVVILAVVIDQVTKAAAREALDGTTEVLIPGVMNLVHVENTGAAFSMGQGATALFIVIALAFVVATLLFVQYNPSMPYYLVVPVALVAGGGLGNMIDRLLDGSVTDFFATAFMNFPVFNVADICVTVGVVWGIVAYWVWEGTSEAETAAEGQDLA